MTKYKYLYENGDYGIRVGPILEGTEHYEGYLVINKVHNVIEIRPTIYKIAVEFVDQLAAGDFGDDDDDFFTSIDIKDLN